MPLRVFIASSKESLGIAYEICTLLENDAEVTPWEQLFELTDLTLPRLIKALEAFDFGIFVFSPDDVVRIRGKRQAAVRDNVLFELGLFMGRLGTDRVFVVRPREASDFRLPTDLLGTTMGFFNADRSDRDTASALIPVCQRIRKAMMHHGKLEVIPTSAQAQTKTIDEFKQELDIHSPTVPKQQRLRKSEQLNLDNIPQTAAIEKRRRDKRSK